MTDRDTIAAIATAPGAGGIGIVRVSGPACRAIAGTLLGRAPSATQRASSRASSTGLPWACSSSTSSPVYECGAGKCSSSPSSMVSPSASRKRR